MQDLCVRQSVYSHSGPGHCRSLHVIKPASAVDHLTLCLVRITTIYHFDWTTSFLSDTGRIKRGQRGSQEKNRQRKIGWGSGYGDRGARGRRRRATGRAEEKEERREEQEVALIDLRARDPGLRAISPVLSSGNGRVDGMRFWVGGAKRERVCVLRRVGDASDGIEDRDVIVLGAEAEGED